MGKGWRRWLLLGVVAVAVGGVALAFLSPLRKSWFTPPVLALPIDDEVGEVRAALSGADGIGEVPAVPEFVVPPKYVPAILRWLRPATYIREPWRLDQLAEVGYIVIRDHAGDELRVRFFDAGANPAVLTVDGVAQFYGRVELVDFGDEQRGAWGSATLANIIRRAHAASRDGREGGD